MISPEQINYYARVYLMKLMDLDPDEGGRKIPVVLDHELYPVEEILESMVLEGLAAIHKRKGAYELTAAGIDLVGRLIDEAEGYIEEFDEQETHDMLRVLEKRGVDALRVRFLWGWYDGEFDDLVEFQRIRGMSPVQLSWAQFLTSSAFYENLRKDLSA